MANLKIDDSTEQSVATVLAYVDGGAAALAADPNFRRLIDDNHQLLMTKLAEGMDIYGANTGFGSSSKNRFAAEKSAELQRNLFSYHGCGVGSHLAQDELAAILFIRTHCLARGYSGVSYDLLRQLQLFLQHRIYPAMPAMGSVGASGDLTPLSYLAAALAGERQVYYQGRLQDSASVLSRLEITPYRFKTREALAIMNGTSVMTGIMVCAIRRLRRIAQQVCEATGLLTELLEGRTSAFTGRTHSVKKHAGQQQAAAIILSMLADVPARYYNNSDGSIQDRYSLRCTPQVVGVLFDCLDWASEWVENEVNSVSDNPIFIEGEVLNAGHFFGGHIAQAADSLKTALATTVNLVDRQMALLLERAPDQLTENLVLRNRLGPKAPLNHGLKALQITMSAISAELIKQSIPMAIFSRPTESSNQDVVSMGTIAARDLTHMLGLAETVMAISFMALVQGFYVRGDLGLTTKLNQKAQSQLQKLAEQMSPIVEDRPLDSDIAAMRSFLTGADSNDHS